MNIRHHELNVPAERPFANCKLAREAYANVLTDIVNTYADGFVLGINNEWGTGKTTFIKMWQQLLKNKGFQTIYFNAWENDFDSNPLVALISELDTLKNSKNEEAFESVLKKGAVLVKNIAPALIKGLVKKYLIDIDMVADAVENVTKASAEILEEEIKEYSSKKKTITEFRKELEKFVKLGNNTNPLIFIVDELDRCRPDYAVELLERIKHFFSVSGIVFVLSIDKKHLASSVKGFYGSEQIDSNEYLRRFIDLEYSLPKPSTRDFINYLIDYYSFEEFFSSNERSKYNYLRDESENFSLMTEYLLVNSNSTLRQQERIFALTRLVLCTFKENQYVFPHLLFVLVYLKVLRDDMFHKIDKNKLTLQELSDLLNDLMLGGGDDSRQINVGYVEALLLWFYNNNRENRLQSDLLGNADGRSTTPIKSRLSNDEDLAGYLLNISKSRYSHFKISYLLKRIDLTEPIRM